MIYKRASGMALPLVLCIASALLILGAMYTKTASEYTVVNPANLLKSKLDILGEGITNIALLKFKELPSDFYYAYDYGRVASISITPIEVFEADTALNGETTDPDNSNTTIKYKTTYKILAQKKYSNDVLVISVDVSAGGLTRTITKTIATNRRRDI